MTAADKPAPQHAQDVSQVRGEARPRKDRHVPRGYSPDRSRVERDAFRPPVSDTFAWQDFCCRTCLAHGQKRMHRNGVCPRTSRAPAPRGGITDPSVVAGLLALRERLA